MGFSRSGLIEARHQQSPEPDQLSGIWYRVDTEPDQKQRIGSDPNHLTFELWDGVLRWSAYDGVNTSSGCVQLGAYGAFQTFDNATTLAGRIPGPSPEEELTIAIVQSAVRISLDEGRLTFYDAARPLGAFYRYGSSPGRH